MGGISLRKIATYLLTYKYMILCILFLVFLQTLSQLYLPTLMGDIVDNGVVAGDIPYIWKIGFWMLVVAAFWVLMSVLISNFSSKVSMVKGWDICRELYIIVLDCLYNIFSTIILPTFT